ncbi:hypothetical protein XA68_17613 [Ophiocordyceps unilateralis]|uniref:Diphthine--ammonia ligase n=1 Tax=Ophiocordyceps unilateralis TaxID=268505 RepID=A0A2A9P2T6_OPHUN|nr:hypothetical protein XA68_17613 [Ophiocordyceps unilateralis]
MSKERLDVIALISGGKDSFFSLLHCLQHGHAVVALANLFPAGPGATPAVEAVDPLGSPPAPEPCGPDPDSFMYQTVGHQLLPLYASATGIPLYRMPIQGRAACQDRDYDGSASSSDETESMVPLLQAIKARHPTANALCSGAILSTYQRTRVESVALRLGLSPLSYLWKYPVLGQADVDGDDDGARLLGDMAAAGLDARIVKVASAGLDPSHLWERVTSDQGVDRLRRALRRFGRAGDGAVLGEGGEFETLVVDGPRSLFKKRLVVPENGRTAVLEGGGAAWIMLTGAELQDKADGLEDAAVRQPELFDTGFRDMLRRIESGSGSPCVVKSSPSRSSSLVASSAASSVRAGGFLTWCFLADAGACSVEEETARVMDKMRTRLSEAGREPYHITNTVIVLRDMSAFTAVNQGYSALFTKPNPPSRVTISCGDLLPPGRSLLLSVTMLSDATSDDRNGLHVQSRSYWAPANIGPYSQAIDVPVTTKGRPRAVFVAGQIPLVPATMALPAETSLQAQAVLSLQHLWRIGEETGVQCWTSAVAYFSRSTSSSDAAMETAKLVSDVWSLAHAPPPPPPPPPSDEQEAGDTVESGPDLWHLRFDRQHMSLGGQDSRSRSVVALPDWDAFTALSRGERPPLFAVEVEGLPRGSGIEWHAHMGFGRLAEACAEMIHYAPDDVGGGWSAWHAVVRTGEAALFVHTVLAAGDWDGGRLEQSRSDAYERAMKRLFYGEVGDWCAQGPYLVYVDATKPWQEADGDDEAPCMLVPCYSIWSSEAGRLGCVALYRAVIEER